MPIHEPPNEGNAFLAKHAMLVATSFRRWTGHELLDLSQSGATGRPRELGTLHIRGVAGSSESEAAGRLEPGTPEMGNAAGSAVSSAGGRSLAPGMRPTEDGAGFNLSSAALGRALFEAPFALVSHGLESDPVFNYGNLTALRLFEMTWEEFTRLPSRMSAEPVHRDERQRLMDEVTRNGFIADYRGVRISKLGRRFYIEQATVWNLVDEAGVLKGQAAAFADWRFLGSDEIGALETQDARG